MLDVLVPVLGRRAGRWVPEFKDGEVVSEPRAVFVGAAGVALQVPDQHLAVLVDGSRRYLVYQGFHYRDLPQGYYDARCVQVFQQPPTVLEPVTRLSRDGLEVTLRVRLVWRVIDPLAVVDKRSFHQSVYQAGLAVTAAFIRSQPYARLVQTPDGKGYSIRRGTRIGPNNGVVSSITERGIIVQERFTDVYGNKQEREYVKLLHPKEGTE